MRWNRFLCVFAVLCVVCAGCNRDSAELSDTTRDGNLSPRLQNLGAFHRTVTTSSDLARKYFDQGVVLVYGFNHAEAIRSFQEVARLDPDCAMAYWGQALAHGPNINDPIPDEQREQLAYEAVRTAVAKNAQASPVEQALIEALATRYSPKGNQERPALNAAYARAMTEVYRAYPNDPDVATLYADAVMNTMPWDYWTHDGRPKPGIAEAVAALEATIRAYPNHPGANHFYIHIVEASPDPDRAVPSADRLGSLVPGAGHLVHMPAHIYIRVGRYKDAVDANLKAIAADEDYITQCRAQGIYPAAYYPHNIHFLSAVLAMEGRSREALDAAGKVSHQHGEEMIEAPDFAFAHLLRTYPTFTLVRFGRWDDILALPEPPGNQPFGRAIHHFARGLAFRAKGDLAQAGAELAAMDTAADMPRLQQLKLFGANSLGALARIASTVLAGELAAARKQYPDAIRRLRDAVNQEDSLIYSEPPDWPIPVRHYLGAELLEAGRAAEAEAVYREDLKRHRDNGWALFGLARSLEAQGKRAEAADAQKRLQAAFARADMTITASRF